MSSTNSAVSGPRLILATDLDGTFAGGTTKERARLQAALAALDGALLLYVTGRTVDATRTLMREADLPRPDLLIADVGTTVVRGEDFSPVAEVEEELDRAWPGGEAVRERLAGLDGVEEQDVRVPRRVSYWLRQDGMDDAISRMAVRLRGLTVDLVGSAGIYIDVLPAGVNKGTTLRRVLRWLGRSGEEVVVAGDTLNDLALFDTGYRAIAVGNCEPGLRERVCDRPHVFVARGEGAAGILEGLRHHGCLEVDHGE